jgi:hypothetical protein
VCLNLSVQVAGVTENDLVAEADVLSSKIVIKTSLD